MRWLNKFGRCIYTSPSGYKVYQNMFYRWFTLDSTVLQTAIKRRKPQKPILYYLPAMTLMTRNQPDSCCLLGLGGAGAAQFLSPYSINITAVDNSEEVIYIAKRYFMANTLNNLDIVHQSAEKYLEQCPTRYGHLLIDLYNSQSFPSECNNDDFFQQCKKLLKRNGFMSVNLANSNEQFAILQLIKNHFINTLVIPIKKCANVVIIASNHQSRDEFIDLLLKTKELKKIVLVSKWGYAAAM